MNLGQVATIDCYQDLEEMTRKKKEDELQRIMEEKRKEEEFLEM